METNSKFEIIIFPYYFHGFTFNDFNDKVLLKFYCTLLDVSVLNLISETSILRVYLFFLLQNRTSILKYVGQSVCLLL